MLMKVLMPNDYLNNELMINGYYRDGDVVMLSSIVVKVMKGGTGTGALPGFWGYLCPPSLRTCLHQNLGEEHVNSQASKIVPIKESIE